MLRVLIVSAQFPIDLSIDRSTFTFVLDEAKGLLESGLEIHVARSWGNDQVIQGINVHCMKRRKIDSLFIKNSLKNLFSLPRSFFKSPKEIFYVTHFVSLISRIVKQCDIELIHAHFAYPEGFVSMLAAERLEVPWVLTLRGDDILMEPTIGYGQRLNPMYDQAVKEVLQKPKIITVASTAVLRAAIEAGAPQNRLKLVPNGVNLSQFRPSLDGSIIKRKWGLENFQVILTVRNLVPKNGVEYLIKAAPLVLKKRPDTIFLIVGQGYLKKELQDLASRLGVADRVIFTGHIPHEQVHDYFAACDVSITPSIIEAFGNVTLEAMACAKPVIGSNVGGISDIIEDGVNGFLVEPRDYEEISKKILYLLDNEDLSKEMGLKGRKIAEEKFDMKKKISTYINVYKSLLHPTDQRSEQSSAYTHA